MKVDYKVMVLHDFKPIFQIWEENLQKQKNISRQFNLKSTSTKDNTAFLPHASQRQRENNLVFNNFQDYAKKSQKCISLHQPLNC